MFELYLISFVSAISFPTIRKKKPTTLGPRKNKKFLLLSGGSRNVGWVRQPMNHESTAQIGKETAAETFFFTRRTALPPEIEFEYPIGKVRQEGTFEEALTALRY